MTPQNLHWLFFLAVTLVYLALSPGSILGMGYTAENLNASSQIIVNVGSWLTRQASTTSVNWPRHGILELVFEIPFLLLSRVFFGSSAEWADRLLALEPIIATSLLCSLIFVWARRLTSSLVWGYALALAAAFGTMLWPYAYIGLETTQSLFLLAAGYLALGPERKRTWLRSFTFALTCVLAVSLKSNGIFLAPAVASLVFFYFSRDSSNVDWRSTRAWAKPLMALSVIAVLYSINAYTRSWSPAWSSGTLRTFAAFNAGGPLIVALNAISLLGSTNKGLIMYAPVVGLSLAALPQAYRIDRRVVIFAGLTLAGLLGGTSLVFFWADETWGPRYLHSSIGPLIICLACARHSLRFQFRREIPLMALTLCGVGISALGSSFYYGALHQAAIHSSRSTIEALQHDPNFNHIGFNLGLWKVWAKRGRPSEQPEHWPPAPRWWFEKPSDAPTLKTVDLRQYASPQPLLARDWSTLQSMPDQITWYIQLASLCLGISLLAGIGYLVWKDRVRPLPPARAPAAEFLATPVEMP